MKKILLLISAIFLLAGCESVMNNPTKRVEVFLNKYQTMDSEVLSQLDDTLNNDNTLTTTQKKSYKDIMKKQYQNLTYKIKDETIDGDNANIEVEIEVFDFYKTQ